MPPKASKTAAEMIPLTPAIYGILLALGDAEMHGYAIMRVLSDRTGGHEKILPGTLYASLSRMVDDGLVEEREAPAGEASGGPQRRYYRRTQFGRAVAQAESERLRRLLEIAVSQNIVPGVVG